MWTFALVVFLVLLALAVFIGIVFWKVPVARWYAATFLASFDFVFTNVPEQYYKEVVRSGAHRKTLLSKEGYKIDENGDIVPLAPGEAPEETLFPGGLMLVGWPFIDKVYRGDMKFLKSLPNGEIKAYEVQRVDKFYARVDYPYAIPFVKCEDKNNLPLLGHATLLAHVENARKSMFATANFYDTMVGLVLPSIRECLSGFSFDQIKKKKDKLDELIWEKLNELNPEDEEPQSVIDTLRKKYGVVIVALRIVNIDPPNEYRDITLTKWRADREADAALAVATAEARKAAGPVDIAMEEWIAAEIKGTTETAPEARKRLRKSGEYEKHKKLLADQINRSRKTVQERVININSGGEPLEGGSIASIAGTIAAAVVGAVAGKGVKDDDSGGTKPSKGDKRKKTEDMSDDELARELDETDD